MSITFLRVACKNYSRAPLPIDLLTLTQGTLRHIIPPTPRQHASEQQGHLEAAAESYRLALQVGGPDAQICFDLAHVLAQAGERQAALERYMQAVELNRDFADAWNNLGVLLAEMERPYAACTAFRRALAAEPLNLRGHYNLADTLDEMGRADEARAHWQTYLKLDAGSERARYASSRLA